MTSLGFNWSRRNKSFVVAVNHRGKNPEMLPVYFAK